MIKSENFESTFNQLIHENISNANFSVEDLSVALHISRMSLYRKTMDTFGQSPSMVLRDRRLEKAKELLRETDLNISEITYEVGLNNPNYFSRLFAEEFGETPTFYRKQHKG